MKTNNRRTRWIHISDLQIGQDTSDFADHDELMEQLIAQVRAEQPDFVIHSGDHVHGAHFDDEKKLVTQWWRRYRRLVDRLARQFPVYNCPGNHDQTRPGRSLEVYCRNIGRKGKQPYYAVTCRDVHLVLMDQLLRAGEHNWSDTGTTRLSHMGAFLPGSTQDRWLRRHLAKGRRAKVMVAVGHWPIFASRFVYFDTDSSLRYDELTNHPGILLPQLLEAEFDLYLCGHHHIYERSRHPRLMQVKTGSDGIAFKGMMRKPNRYAVLQDYRGGYTRFAFDPSSNRIHGEAVAYDGEVFDSWSQKAKN